MDNANVIEATTVPTNDLSLGSVVRIPAVRQVMLLIGVAVPWPPVLSSPTGRNRRG